VELLPPSRERHDLAHRVYARFKQLRSAEAEHVPSDD
jgi:hypothetical protein